MAEYAPMTQISKSLKQIILKIEAQLTSGRSTLVVFDLDSTLFDVSPRIQKILHEFLQDPNSSALYPDILDSLKKVQIHSSDWGIVDALTRAGLEGKHPEFHQAIKDFWARRFFSNEYLHYDVPYKGASEFVNQIYQLGSDICYLSGRDIPRMGKGTIDVLQKWNFPFDQKKAKICLKSHHGIEDTDFKSGFFTEIPEGKFEGIWFFENEPLNVNVVQKNHQHVEIVFFESTHSRKAHPPEDVFKIIHYLMDDL